MLIVCCEFHFQNRTPKSETSECLFIDSGFDVTTNVTSARIRKCTRTDPVLSQVYNYVVCGWPTVKDLIFVPYKNKKDELSAIQGCVLWGSRVIIPKSLQSAVLEELHCNMYSPWYDTNERTG